MITASEADEVPKAFVVPSGPITAEEVTRFVAGRVAPDKKLRAVEIVEEIPKSPSGKILRRVLIERERTAAIPGQDR
ncbi:MAG: AMP-binding enzyme [Streptosporangiaceae bacterium]